MPFLGRTLSLRFFWSIVVDFLTYFYSLLHIVVSDGRSSVCAHLGGIIVVGGILPVEGALAAIEEYLVPITCFGATRFCCGCARLDHLLLELRLLTLGTSRHAGFGS